MIYIEGLSQSFRRQIVLDRVNLTVEKNEVCALVGRNGAGKTTLIYSMLDLLPVKEGRIELCGIPHHQAGWKRKVAYLPEKFQLYPHLTGEENMMFFASLKDGLPDRERMEECLQLVNLWEKRREKIKAYSKGMLQRLGLAVTLVYDAELLILDEPTSGLDPIGREEILSILHSLRDKTILFSSHHMDEIRQISSHVAFLEAGGITKFSLKEFDEKILLGGKVR